MKTKIKIMALVLLVVLPALAVTAAYATKPQVGHGTVTLVNQTKLESRLAGDNNITTYKNTFMLTGALSGTAVSIERDVRHASGDNTFTTFQGKADFTSGASDSSTSSGTLEIVYVGINNGTFIHGQFVAGHGTGTFADFHGQGDFSGTPGKALNYTINWHVEPQPHTKDSR